MTVPNVGVLNSKTANRKHRLLPEIPATRFSCFSGSLRPKLGLCILFVLLVIGICAILVPLIDTPIMSSSSSENKITNQEAVNAVAKSNSAFTTKLYNQLLSQQDGNMVMSSYSVSAVMGMVYAGAQGKTLQQMKEGLSFPEAEHLNQGYGEILSALKGNENFTLNTANRLYVQENYKLLDSFLEVTKSHFHAVPELTNFANEPVARKLINDWVESQTNQKIKDLIPSGVLTSLTRLVLVNAIYFKGDWAKKFDAKNTKKAKFLTSKGKEVETDMMGQEVSVGMNKVKDLDATAIEIPYKGNRLGFVILLPNQRNGLAEMEKKLVNFDLHNLTTEGLAGRNKPKVKLFMPKFKLETSHNLVEPLKNLGMTEMFNPNTEDFGGMAPEKDLYVSAVVQKAFIEVNEEGSEAAAATGAVMMTRMMPMPPQDFRCDHPFIFLIKDNLTNMILFAGRVTDPTIA